MADDTLSPDAVPFTPSGLRQAGINPAPSSATLHRWRLHGLRDIRIRTFLRGGRRYVDRSALAEFFESLTAAADGAVPAVKITSTSARDRAIQQAAAELEADGI